MCVVEIHDTLGNNMAVQKLPEETPNDVDRSLMLAFIVAIDVRKAGFLCHRKTTLKFVDDK
jgi:hypothetical protein